MNQINTVTLHFCGTRQHCASAPVTTHRSHLLHVFVHSPAPLDKLKTEEPHPTIPEIRIHLMQGTGI